ncbi:MAG: mRNA surveillance protein pelota [Thermoplasmata archaeon]|nr:mRNA surveillance protein pelota [Thermoplasmata archaeon]
MRILKQDLKKGEIKLLVDNLNDLWYLYNLIQEDDLVFGITFRRDEKQSDKLRPDGAEKKKIRLGLRVNNVEFHEFSDRLRVHGVIESFSKGDISLGSHHTLNFVTGDNLTIVKEPGWAVHQLDQLQEAVKATKIPVITLLALEDDNATLAVLYQYGVQHVATIPAHISGKQYESSKSAKNEKSQYFGEILSQLKQLKREESPLVIIGPGFTKNELMKFAEDKEPGLVKNCKVYNTGQAGMTGIQEVLKSSIIKNVIQDLRVVHETEQVERLFGEISKNGLFVYGPNEVEDALKRGAVETLLLTDIVVRTKQADVILELARATGSKPMIISTVHEAGKKLDGIGGIGGILRYKL